MPSALQVACQVDTDRPQRRWHPLFFLDWWNGSSVSDTQATTTTTNKTTPPIDNRLSEDPLLRACERAERNGRALEELERRLRGGRVKIPSSPPSPLPTTTTSHPQEERPKTCDVGVQTHQDPRLTFYQQQLEAKMDQFNEQEQMITRLQEHLEIVKEQLDEARAKQHQHQQ